MVGVVGRGTGASGCRGVTAPPPLPYHLPAHPKCVAGVTSLRAQLGGLLTCVGDERSEPEKFAVDVLAVLARHAQVSLAGVELPCGDHVPVPQLILGAPYRPGSGPRSGSIPRLSMRLCCAGVGVSLPGRLPGDPNGQVLSPHIQLAVADGQGAAGLDVGEKESVTACPSDLPLRAPS